MKSFKQFKEENTTCKAGEYYCNTDQKCKPIPSGYKVDADGMLMKEEPRIPRKSGQPAGSKKHSDLYNEDAPANNAGAGNIAGIGVGPAGEPGINVKKKKKKTILMGTIKRNIKENFDNNSVLLKQILDGLDKVDVVVDTMNKPKTEIQVIKEQPKKSFKERYKLV